MKRQVLMVMKGAGGEEGRWQWSGKERVVEFKRELMRNPYILFPLQMYCRQSQL